jgi:hypothetical protein
VLQSLKLSRRLLDVLVRVIRTTVSQDVARMQDLQDFVTKTIHEDPNMRESNFNDLIFHLDPNQ